MKTLNVSDHALLRLLERAGGIDVEAVRGAIARSIGRAVAVADKVGASEYVIVSDGYCYVVTNDTVVTVYREPKR